MWWHPTLNKLFSLGFLVFISFLLTKSQELKKLQNIGLISIVSAVSKPFCICIAVYGENMCWAHGILLAAAPQMVTGKKSAPCHIASLASSSWKTSMWETDTANKSTADGVWQMCAFAAVQCQGFGAKEEGYRGLQRERAFSSPPPPSMCSPPPQKK